MKIYYTTTILLFLTISVTAQLNLSKEIKKHRKGYKKDFLNNDHSPLEKKQLKYLRFYDVDENYRVKGEFTRTPNAKPFEMPTSSGITKKYVQYGTITFDLNGERISLAVYESLRLRAMPQYKNHLFIPFKDATNNKTTYGGGRYLDVSKLDIRKNILTIDFNKVYNPYCAFSDGYSCPIPPKENHLTIAIEAGEKKFAQKH